jgi:hypothetical protein
MMSLWDAEVEFFRYIPPYELQVLFTNANSNIEEWLSSLQLRLTHSFLGFYSALDIFLEAIDFLDYRI